MADHFHIEKFGIVNEKALLLALVLYTLLPSQKELEPFIGLEREPTPSFLFFLGNSLINIIYLMLSMGIGALMGVKGTCLVSFAGMGIWALSCHFGVKSTPNQWQVLFLAVPDFFWFLAYGLCPILFQQYKDRWSKKTCGLVLSGSLLIISGVSYAVKLLDASSWILPVYAGFNFAILALLCRALPRYPSKYETLNFRLCFPHFVGIAGVILMHCILISRESQLHTLSVHSIAAWLLLTIYFSLVGIFGVFWNWKKKREEWSEEREKDDIMMSSGEKANQSDGVLEPSAMV